ncbi:MAG: aminotransferase class V-fold PLP-dependent enzyme [Candidatus Aminicenantaceae bacterium]
MIDWKKIRNDFPITKKIVYFDSAAMSPIPTPVFKSLVANYQELYQYGDINWHDDIKKYRSLCAELANLIHTDSDNVTFVPNTSTAMALVALSFKNQFRKSFNIVSMQDEFPSSTICFEYQNIEMRYVEPIESRYHVKSILELIDDKTISVITSYIQYSTGFRQDLYDLGRELKKRGIIFVVNATQGFPYYPVDVKAMHIDVLSASLHKWGLTGHIGSVFFTSPAFRNDFSSPIAGWLSVKTKEGEFIHTAKNAPFSLLKSAHRYNFGTYNLQSILAFQTALNYLKDIGFKNIQNRIMKLTDYLIQGLKKLDITIVTPVARQNERSPIVSFSLGAKNEALVRKLAEKNIHVSARGGNIRVSVNIFNNFKDIDLLLNALKSI